MGACIREPVGIAGLRTRLTTVASHFAAAARHTGMKALLALLSALAALTAVVSLAPASSAAPCPDVEVVFARGTTEAPGVGYVGQAFVDALRGKVGARSVGVYAVNYPASNEFDVSAPAGARDASRHITSVAASCPNTRLVLGGYSQGAAVVDIATTDLPANISDRVAAIADFGAPRTAFADSLSAGPLPAIAPAFAGKLIDSCVQGDPICSPGGWDWGAHAGYVATGLVDQAAASAAGRL